MRYLVLHTFGGLAAFIATYWLIEGSNLALIWYFVVLALAGVGIWRGLRLPLVARVYLTAAILEMAFSVCLQGRTMEPFTSFSTVASALWYFFLFALGPTTCLLRIWPRPYSIRAFAVALPLALGTAIAAAEFEERQFIVQHRQGIGPTARWTVPHHWLAYDAEKQLLYGSD